MDNIKFGKFIKELRAENNMTQKQLAEKLYITDKAVSKWERGLSLPDISLLENIAEIFGVSVSELVNGERDTASKDDEEPDTYQNSELDHNDDIQYQNRLQENNYDISEEIYVLPRTLEEYKKDKFENFRKRMKPAVIVSLVLAGALIILQLAYNVLNTTKGIEYPFAYEENVIIELCALFLFFGMFFLSRSKSRWRAFSIIILIFMTSINYVFLVSGPKETVKVDYSPGYSNCAIVKRNTGNGQIKLYRPFMGVFCKEHDVISDSSTKLQYIQWMNSDVCLVTYASDFGAVKGYAATYGDRSDGISYYSVCNAVTGTWTATNESADSVGFICDKNGIKITYNGTDYEYSYSDTEQYGTTAVILSGDYSDEYIIALNEDCVIDDVSGIIEDGGTVTLCKIGENSAPVVMNCKTSKQENLEEYSVVSPPAGEYEVYNGIIYYSYDGVKTYTAPAEIRGDKLCDNGSDIDEDITYFTVREDNGAKIFYKTADSDEWKNTAIQLDGYFEIGSMGFLDENNIYMLAFVDFAMTDAFGSIKYTSNGGKTWSDRSYGVGENDFTHFKINSECLFIDENTAFLTMPSGSGEDSKLYISTDGGRTFSPLTFDSAGDYDYYNLPLYENGVLTVKNTMGSDADNTELSKTFVSEDKGKTWTEKE